MSEKLAIKEHFDVIAFDELGSFEITDQRLLELVSAGVAQLEEDDGLNGYCPTKNSCTINTVPNCGGSAS